MEAVGPDAAELERLADRLKAGNRRRSGVLRPALIAAVLVVVLLASVCAVSLQGWLEPVVDYGDNGALIEEYTMVVNETREGRELDLTLENLVTDGGVVYCRFAAEFAEDYDFDAALSRMQLTIWRPSWMPQVSVLYCDMVSRVDDRSQKGRAEFIATFSMDRTGGFTQYYVDEDGNWVRDHVTSLLGRVYSIAVDISDERPWDPDLPDWGESFWFEDIQFNDDIDSVELVLKEGEFLEDGTPYTLPSRMVVTPCSVSIDFRDILLEAFPEDMPFQTAYGEALARWQDTDWVKEFDMRLVLSDGTHLKLSDLRGGSYRSQIGAGTVERKFELWFRGEFYFSELRRPETVVALILDGVRYEAVD